MNVNSSSLIKIQKCRTPLIVTKRDQFYGQCIKLFAEVFKSNYVLFFFDNVSVVFSTERLVFSSLFKGMMESLFSGHSEDRHGF